MTEALRLLCYWLGLALLTVATVRAAGGHASWLAVAIVALAIAKAWLIVDGFMEMRHAPRGWRLLVLAWPLMVAAGVLLAAFGPAH